MLGAMRTAAVTPPPADRASAARRPPRLRNGTLHRERLVRRLAQAADIPLVLVVAPAGYGKTTLLVHWVERDPRALAWISLEPAHDDPGRLLAAVTQALNGIGPERSYVLVLDGVDRLRSGAVTEALSAIADGVAAGSQLVLASRWEPSLPIGRLRAQGTLVDLGTRDLAMTRRDAAAMLDLAGLELSREEVLMLVQQTEGWPAALYLAALSLHQTRGVPRRAGRFGGADRLMADYLRDEVLGRLADDEIAFLRRTSVLDTLSGPLCDAVLDRMGSGHILRELSRSNVPMVALDSSDATYRYHGMLTQMLEAELHRTEPRIEPELHRRASAWYARSGDIEQAIGHASEAGDVARAGELLWTIAPGRVLEGRNAKVRRWLEPFSPEQIAAHPSLALTAAASHLAMGERDLVEHCASAAERGIGEAAGASLRAGVAIMRAAVARDGIDQMARDAESAYELSPGDSPWLSLCCLLRGVAAHLRGRPEEAVLQLEEGARRGAIAAPCIQVLCLAQLALLAVEANDWEQGPLLAARARAQVERLGLARYPIFALVHAVSALVRAHRDRVEDAQADRRRAVELLTELVDYVPWYDVETRLVLARVALRLGDVTGTRTLVGEASHMLPRAEDAVTLKAWRDELLSQVEAFALTTLIGPSSLTTAELRVLGLLPTHLSFREMGRRLHVSANTIKTHAHAVYRKLDVCSRSDAVVRAREMGLLDTAA
jgi:LuxR family maltose regulon positive regulatory protein